MSSVIFSKQIPPERGFAEAFVTFIDFLFSFRLETRLLFCTATHKKRFGGTDVEGGAGRRKIQFHVLSFPSSSLGFFFFLQCI